MSVVGAAVVDVRANTTPFKNQIRGALGTALKITGGFFAAKGAFDFLKGGIEGAIKAQEQMGALRNAVENTGSSFDAAAPQIQATLDRLRSVGDISRGELRPALTRLVQGTGDVTKSQQLLSIAVDVSRGRHIDLLAATQLLSRVNAGMGAGSLRRLGIAYTNTTTNVDKLKGRIAAYVAQKKTESAAGKAVIDRHIQELKARMAGAKEADKEANKTQALALVQKRYAGAAAEYASTTAGKLENLRLRFREIQTSIGKTLLGAVAYLATIGVAYIDRLNAAFQRVRPRIEAVVRPVLGWINTYLVQPLRKAIDWLGGLKTAIGAAAIAFIAYKAATAGWAALQAMWKALQVAIFLVRNAQIALNVAMEMNPIGIIITAIALLGLAFYEAYQHSATFRRIVNEALAGVKQVAADLANYFVANWWPAIKTTWDQVTSVIADAWGVITSVVTVGVAVLSELWTRFGSTITQAVRLAWNLIRIQFQTGFNIVRGLVNFFLDALHGRWGAALNDLWGVVKTVFSGIRKTITTVLTSLPSLVWSLASNIGQALYDGFTSMIGGITNFVLRNVASAVNVAIDVINNLIDAANKIPGVGIDKVGKVSWGTGPRQAAPAHPAAQGLVVRKPTLILSGEKEPEATIPLSQLSGILADAIKKTRGADTTAGVVVENLHVYANTEADARRAARAVMNEFAAGAR